MESFILASKSAHKPPFLALNRSTKLAIHTLIEILIKITQRKKLSTKEHNASIMGTCEQHNSWNFLKQFRQILSRPLVDMMSKLCGKHACTAIHTTKCT